jgi:hypothetical protein
MQRVAMGSVVGARGSCDCAQDDSRDVILRAVANVRRFAPRVILRARAGVRRFAPRVILRARAGVRRFAPRVILRAVAGSTPATTVQSTASAR